MPGEPRVRFESLERAEYDSLRELARLAPGTVDASRVDGLIRDAAEARLGFARDLLAYGRLLAADRSAPGDHAQRLALNRAYYAAHHALRALYLRFRQHDPYGHQAAIDYWEDFGKEERVVAAKLSGVPNLSKGMKNLMERRHIADYHPFNRASAKDDALDFAAASAEALGFSEAIVLGVESAFADRAAGRI